MTSAPKSCRHHIDAQALRRLKLVHPGEYSQRVGAKLCLQESLQIVILHLQLRHSCSVAHQAQAGRMCQSYEAIQHGGRGILRSQSPFWQYVCVSHAMDVVGDHSVVGWLQGSYV